MLDDACKASFIISFCVAKKELLLGLKRMLALFVYSYCRLIKPSVPNTYAKLAPALPGVRMVYFSNTFNTFGLTLAVYQLPLSRSEEHTSELQSRGHLV